MAERKPVTRERLENLEQRTRTTTFEMVPGDKASPAPPNAGDVLDLIAEVQRLQSALVATAEEARALRAAMEEAQRQLFGALVTRDVGICRACGGPTSSGVHRLCRKCNAESVAHALARRATVHAKVAAAMAGVCDAAVDLQDAEGWASATDWLLPEVGPGNHLRSALDAMEAAVREAEHVDSGQRAESGVEDAGGNSDQRTFMVVLEAEDAGGYHVSCPVLKGCHSQGENLEEAVANIREVIGLYLESMIAHGDPIPVDDVCIRTVTVEV